MKGRFVRPFFFFMKQYKMLCLDLDGTLLTDAKAITERNVKAVEAAHAHGLDIVIATGRQFRKAKEFTEQFSIPLTLITNNGTVFREGKSGKRIKHHAMDAALIAELLERAKGMDLLPILHVDQYDDGYDIVIPKTLPKLIVDTYVLEQDWVRFVDDVTVDHAEGAVSLVFFGTKADVETLGERLTKDNPHPMQVHMMYNLTHFEAMLEILGPEGTKWHAIEEYAKDNGIQSDEIVAIGDDSNDIQMLANVGLSFAPANAVPGVKEAARIVLDETNDEDAVAIAIEKVIG